MFRISYLTKGFTTKVIDLDVGTEYEARKAVARIQDYDMVVQCDCIPIESLRQLAAENVYSTYDFGEGVMVEDCGGWEHSNPGDLWNRAVFVRFDGAPEAQSSTKLNFSVQFAAGSTRISEASSLDSKGSMWGVWHVSAACDRTNEVVGVQG